MNKRKVFIYGMAGLGLTQALISKIEADHNVEIVIDPEQANPEVFERKRYNIEILTIKQVEITQTYDPKPYGKHYRRELNRYKPSKKKR